MIRGIHGLFYSSDAEATRAFFRDVMRLPGKDTGGGWWIFDFGEADMGVHPIDEGGTAGGHDVSFYCDDIHGTVADMKARGAEFEMDIADHGYGLVTYLTAPGGLRIQLYEPRYRTFPASGPQKRTAAKRPPARTPVRAPKQAAKRTGPKRKAAPAARKRTAPKSKPAAKRAKATRGARRR